MVSKTSHTELDSEQLIWFCVFIWLMPTADLDMTLSSESLKDMDLVDANRTVLANRPIMLNAHWPLPYYFPSARTLLLDLWLCTA